VRELYLVHHNRPELLIAQISILSKLCPENRINIVLTCDFSSSPLIFREFIKIINNYKLNYFLSDSNISKFERYKNKFFALPHVNLLTLKIPYFRQKFGQDPSSGHARALDKVLNDSIKKPFGTEVWIIEGDVFPLSNFNLNEMRFDIYGSVTNIKILNKEYFNGRVFAYRITPYLKELIIRKKLTFKSRHTFFNWFDTGSLTEKIIKSYKINRKLCIRLMPGLTDSQWKNSDIDRISTLYQGFAELVKKDTRSKNGNCSFDLYDGMWLHIGKASGYYKFKAEFDFDKFCLEVCDFALNQVNK
jgi:hypothetical protein